MSKKNKTVDVTQQSISELVSDFLSAGGKIKKLPAGIAPGAYRAGVVKSMSKK